MNWSHIIRNGGLYAVLLGGGTNAALAYALPSSSNGFAVMLAIALGAFLLIRAALMNSKGTEPMRGGGPAAASTMVSLGLVNSRSKSTDRNAGAPSVFYGVGLVVFGFITLAVLF